MFQSLHYATCVGSKTNKDGGRGGGARRLTICRGRWCWTSAEIQSNNPPPPSSPCFSLSFESGAPLTHTHTPKLSVLCPHREGEQRKDPPCRFERYRWLLPRCQWVLREKRRRYRRGLVCRWTVRNTASPSEPTSRHNHPRPGQNYSQPKQTDSTEMGQHWPDGSKERLPRSCVPSAAAPRRAITAQLRADPIGPEPLRMSYVPTSTFSVGFSSHTMLIVVWGNGGESCLLRAMADCCDIYSPVMRVVFNPLAVLEWKGELVPLCTSCIFSTLININIFDSYLGMNI